VEEVRSGHSEEPLEPHEPPTGGALAWGERIQELGAAIGARCSPGWRPMASPSQCASRCASMRAPARSRSGQSPRACRWSNYRGTMRNSIRFTRTAWRELRKRRASAGP